MSNRVRLAVIGIGHLGRHHARIASALEGAELVAVVDIDAQRAAAAATATGAVARTNYREVIEQVDAVTIAVPTEQHRDIALPFLERFPNGIAHRWNVERLVEVIAGSEAK